MKNPSMFDMRKILAIVVACISCASGNNNEVQPTMRCLWIPFGGCAT